MKKVKLILAPVFIAVVGIFLLCIVSTIPNEQLHDNYISSAKQFDDLIGWDRIINQDDFAYTIDTATDHLIIMESYTTNSFSRVLLNPHHDSGESMASDILESADENIIPEINYSRYWMGFRIIYRPLMILFSYHEIRKIMSAMFLLLIVFLSACVGKMKGYRTTIAFGLSLVFVNPVVISHSLQSVCDFLLAFIFSLIIINLQSKNKVKVPLLFCIFGSLTQFFDFYTTPIITYGIPLVILLSSEEMEIRDSIKISFIALISWAYGYVAMWVIKLIITTVLTQENALKIGFESFLGRIGAEKNDYLESLYPDLYSPKRALYEVWVYTVGNRGENKILKLLLLIIISVSVAVVVKNKAINPIIDYSIFLIIAVIPLIWFMAAAQPTRIHAFFQYRGIMVFLFGVFEYINCCLSSITENRSKKCLKITEN